MRISDWSSDVCSSDLTPITPVPSTPDTDNPGTPGDPGVPTTTDVPSAPSLALSKAVTSEGPYAVDDYINYDIVIRNTGNVTLTRSAEHTSELQSLMRISYAVFCLKK